MPPKRRLTLVQRSFRPSSDGLGERVVHGAGFTFLGIALRTLVTIGSMAILARLLSPADFGHIAMATVVTELAALFANFGFGSILIQKPKITRIQLDTIFWAALSLGVILSALVFGFSFSAEFLFADPTVGEILRVLCITFVLDELTVVPNSTLSRLLMFKQLLVVQIAMLFLRATAAILLAVMGAGIWSLVGGVLVGNCAQLAAYTSLVGYRPRWKFSNSFLKSTWRTNGSYFGGGFLFYISSNIDLYLVGRSLGAVSLGYYQNARSLTDEIRARIAMPLQRVLFPAFSAIQSDLERFQQVVTRSGRLLAAIVIPIGFGVGAVSDELVPILYGEQWLAMIPILQIISAGSGIRAASTMASPIFNATDRVGLSLRLNIISTVVFVASIAIGNHWGLVGVAYGLLLNAAISIVMFRIALGLIELSTKHLWAMMGWPLLASAAMFAVIAIVRPLMPEAISGVANRLVVLVVTGVGVYSALIFIFARSHLFDMLTALSHLKRR